MKNFLIITILMVSAFGFGQDKDKASVFEKKNELKIGGIHLLALRFNATYEYLHSKDFTYGSSILIGQGSDLESFSITPFMRFYFQETKEYGAHGFYLEIFAKYLNGNWNGNYSASALGLSVGKKWVNTNGFVVETLFGAGRVIAGTTNSPDLVLRGDLFIGYRF
jgi:hypothetical protein